MVIKTKKYKLDKNKYIKLAFKNILKQQWWIITPVFLIILGLGFYLKSYLLAGLSILVLVIYLGFWILQFYGVTMMDQSKLIFARVNYEISSKKIIIFVSTKQGVPIEWNQVKKVEINKKYFLFILSKAHIIYLPYSIFNNENSVTFLKTLVKRKNLI